MTRFLIDQALKVCFHTIGEICHKWRKEYDITWVAFVLKRPKDDRCYQCDHTDVKYLEIEVTYSHKVIE